MKSFKNLFLFTLLLGAKSLTIAGCCEESLTPENDGIAEVEYKLIGSEGVNITKVVYNVNNAPVTKTGDLGSSWTSDKVINHDARTTVTAQATGLSDLSTLKAQIWMDGKVVKESTLTTGKTLSTTLSLQ